MTKYRKDIQTIRGVCLFAIFIYHYNKFYLNTGYIGVDIFFLISGYVNSLSFQTKKELSYSKYYLRRATRIVPVSWITLACSCLIISYMNIIYRRKLFLDILSANMSVSNYRFIFLSTDYLSLSERPSIILHYWSLSVKDQFYILFPFLFNKILIRKELILFILFCSYMYSVYLCFYYPIYAYFSSPARLWEFLIGVSYSTNEILKKKKIVNYIFLIILVSIIFLKNIEKLSPSFSVIPISLVLYIINNENEVYSLLSIVLEHLRNISYCFYLFHYVIIYICDNFLFKKNVLLCFTFTYLLFVFFYYFYEKPIRTKVSVIFFQVPLLIAFHTSLLLLVLYLLKQSTQKINVLKEKRIEYSYKDILNKWRYYESYTLCPFNNFISNKKNLSAMKNVALFIVDSHVEQWFDILIPYFLKNNYILVEVYCRLYDAIIKKN